MPFTSLTHACLTVKRKYGKIFVGVDALCLRALHRLVRMQTGLMAFRAAIVPCSDTAAIGMWDTGWF